MKNFDFATLTRLDLEIMDTQNKIKYIKVDLEILNEKKFLEDISKLYE